MRRIIFLKGFRFVLVGVGGEKGEEEVVVVVVVVVGEKEEWDGCGSLEELAG